jgi:hypothetical protein
MYIEFEDEDLELALAEQGSLPDPDTELVHLGNGRWYAPELGRPLQPNPAGGPPTVPQALNRYAATPLGQPGVAEAVENGGNILADPTAWTGLAADIGLEIYSQRVLAESGQLVLEDSLSAIGKTLGLGQGKFALGSLEIERVVLGGVPVARATLRNVGKVLTWERANSAWVVLAR